MIQRTALTLLLACVFASSAASASCDLKKRSQIRLDRYVVKPQTIYDKQRRLTWQRCSVGQTWDGKSCLGPVDSLTWDDAWDAAFHAGAGWRVPTKEELLTLISQACHDPAVNEQAFPGMDPDNLLYWSGTQDSNGVWIVNFGNGGLRQYRGQIQQYAVRLVRTGR
jgi:hypothetical protein